MAKRALITVGAFEAKEFIFASASQIGRAIGNREISSLEVTEACLERIREVNPRLNAVFFLAEESALKGARMADEELDRGYRRSELHGVPITVKDWIEVAGMPCLAGEEKYRGYVPSEDATVVARMRQAGCIILGKTVVTADSPVYGRCDNPYRAGYSPAGSSSGEAAIIAAGGSPLGLGSDSGGSIRDPANHCGIAGLRPTTGRVPLTGHLPRINTFVDPRTAIGPMARHVEDLAVALTLLSGPDMRDPSVAPMPLADWRQVELKGLRGAFYARGGGYEPSQDCEQVAKGVAKALREAGAEIEETIPPRLDEVWTITREYWSRPGSEGLEDQWLPDGEAKMSAIEVERHLIQWDRFRRSMLRFMEGFDFILTPAGEQPPQPHGEGKGQSYALPYSLCGYPSIVVRAGTSSDGLPVGVQIIARPWREDVILALAGKIESRFGGWQAPNL